MLSRLFRINAPSCGESKPEGQESTSSLLFDADHASGIDKIMLCGPPEVGKTSLLFEVALSFADEGKHVLFICPRKLSRLPLLAHGRTQPSSSALKYIQRVYLETKDEFLNHMASIHMSSARVFHSIIVDNIDAYFPAHIRNEDLSSIAKIFALTVDAFLFQKSKQIDQPKVKHSGLLMMSVTVPIDTNSVPRQSFYERWVQFVLQIQVKAANLCELSVLPSNSRDGSSLASVVYKITDQSVVVQETEYCPQSAGLSAEVNSCTPFKA